MASRSWTTTSKPRTFASLRASRTHGQSLCARLRRSPVYPSTSPLKVSPLTFRILSSQPVDSSDLSPIPRRNEFTSQGSCSSNLYSLMKDLQSNNRYGMSSPRREIDVDDRLRELMGQNSGSLYDYLNELRSSSRDSARDRLHQLMNEPRSNDTDSLPTQAHNFPPRTSNPFVSES